MIAPGGMLLLIESTVHLAWFDMTTGLIEGWQHFADDLRTDNPLLAPATWVQALRDAGFEDALASPGDDSVATALGQHVLVARVAGKVRAVADEAPMEVSASHRDGSGTSTAEGQTVPFRERLLQSLPAERLDLLRDLVREHVMRVLRLDASNPPGGNARLMDLGFDSLMAVQLRNQISKDLGLDRPLPATLMFDRPTINTLSAYLLDCLNPQENADVNPVAAPSAYAVPQALDADTIAGISDQEIEAMLIERLSKS